MFNVMAHFLEKRAGIISFLFEMGKGFMGLDLVFIDERNFQLQV